MEEDEYYAEIEICVDGWAWNVSEAHRLHPLFPSADRVCMSWELESRRRALALRSAVAHHP